MEVLDEYQTLGFFWPMFFAFWSWVKAEKCKHLKRLRGDNCTFSLPRVWRSYSSRMTTAERLMDGPWEHLLGQCLEPKSQMWILPLALPCACIPASKPASLLSHQGWGGPEVISSLGNWIVWQKPCTSLREQILWGPGSSRCSPSELYQAWEGPNQSYCCPIPAASQPLLGAALLSFSTSLINHFLHKHHRGEVRLFWTVLKGRRLATNTLPLWRQVQGVASVSSVTQYSRKSQGCWD